MRANAWYWLVTRVRDLDAWHYLWAALTRGGVTW